MSCRYSSKCTNHLSTQWLWLWLFCDANPQWCGSASSYVCLPCYGGSCLWASIPYPSYSAYQRNYHSYRIHPSFTYWYIWNYKFLIFCQHIVRCTVGIMCLPNCFMGTLFQDSSYSQYTCCLIFCRNRLWEGSVRLAWHVPSSPYCELLKEILFVVPLCKCSEHIYRASWLDLWLYLGGTWLAQHLSCRFSWFSLSPFR
jgi:hypothetical protein